MIDVTIMQSHGPAGLVTRFQPPGYTCSVCQMAVVVMADGSKTHGCAHRDAPIHANMQAVVSAGGGVAPPR